MLTPYSRSQFVEKLITDAHGREFKAIFFVSLENGEIRARLVSIKPIAQPILALKGSVSNCSLCLSGNCALNALESACALRLAPCASPYFNLLELILNSQPTRAPSRK